MSKVSAREADDLLRKLFNERIALDAVLMTPTGFRCTVKGFVDSVTEKLGIVISRVRPSPSADTWLICPLPDATCEFEYGDAREIPAAALAAFADRGRGDSVLLMSFSTGEVLGLFFTI